MAIRYRSWCFSDAERNKRLHTSAAWRRQKKNSCCVIHARATATTYDRLHGFIFILRVIFISFIKQFLSLCKNYENQDRVSSISPLRPPVLGRRHSSHWNRSEQSQSCPLWTDGSWRTRTSNRTSSGPRTQTQNSKYSQSQIQCPNVLI